MARILQPTPQNLDHLATALATGEIVAIPTETVYGLAGNALNPEAIARIYKAKDRPARNPLIVHVGELQQLKEIAEVSGIAQKLISEWWPGPLTLILRRKPVVPDSVTAGQDTVAVRMPAHPIFQALAKRCNFPLAAPSANPSGYVSPTQAEHVQRQMHDRIDWILDGGSCEKGIESTILSLVDPEKPALLRHGSISIDQLAASLGMEVAQPELTESGHEEGLISPGLMKRHYSPTTDVRLFEGFAPEVDAGSAILFLSKESCQSKNHFAFSNDGDLSDVARNLYATLQELDSQKFECLYLELPQNTGTGVALRDRMNRAAAKD
jgi:L-threonylcarbamoyladenylate synthase